MTTKQITVRSVMFRDRDFPGFLDMMRYDRCTVRNWSHAQGDGYWEVELASAPDRTKGHEFTVDRWASFGLTLSAPMRSY